MTDAPLKPFGIRVTPYCGESLLSLITRAAEGNVFPRTTDVLELAGVAVRTPAFVPFTKPASATAIAQRLDLPEETVSTRMHGPTSENRYMQSVNWYGTPMPRRFIDADGFRFSPMALGQAAFHRAVWMLRPLSFCPETMELLISECQNPGCKRKLGWKYGRPLNICEKCRRPLVDAQTSVLPPGLQEAARQVAQLASPDPKTRAGAIKRLPSPFRDWEGGDVFCSIVELGPVVSDGATRLGDPDALKIGNGDFSLYSTEHLVEAYEFVRRWPNSLRDIIAQRTYESGGKLDDRLGPVGKYFRSHKSPTKLRELIRSEVPAILREQNVPIKFRPGTRITGLGRAGVISVTEASKLFEVDVGTIRRLREQGNCFVARQPATQGLTLYDEKKLGESISILRGSAKEFECRTAIGVPAHCLRALVSAGLLTSIEDHDALLMAGGDLFDRRSMDTLISRMNKVRETKKGSGVRPSELMLHQFHPDTWVRVIQGVLNNQIMLVGKNRNYSSPFERWVVDKEELRIFIDGLSLGLIPTEIMVTSDAAEKMLGVPAGVICAAIRQGFLAGHKKAKRVMVPLSKLAEFDAKFITSIEGRAHTGTTYREFVAHLEKCNITPVTKLNKTYVWIRRAVDGAFAMKPLRLAA